MTIQLSPDGIYEPVIDGPYEPGTNTAYYALEAQVCAAIRAADANTLERLARGIERRGTTNLVRELATFLPGITRDESAPAAAAYGPTGELS